MNASLEEQVTLPPLAELLPLAAAARSLASSRQHAGHVHPSTLTRWILKGVKRGSGRARLRAVKLGGVWMTSAQWLAEFAEEASPAEPAAGGRPLPSCRRSRARSAEDREADRILDAAGI